MTAASERDELIIGSTRTVTIENSSGKLIAASKNHLGTMVWRYVYALKPEICKTIIMEFL